MEDYNTGEYLISYGSIEERNEQLAQWAGLSSANYRFDLSLDLCNAYLIPVANKLGWRVSVEQVQFGDSKWLATLISDDYGIAMSYGKSAPDALFCAMEFFVEGK